MNVLNVNNLIDTNIGGGTAERTIQMSYFLAKEKIDVSIYSTNIGITDAKLAWLANIRLFLKPCIVKRFYIPRFSMSELKRLVSEADIIHLMNHWTVINAIVYYWVKKMNKPYVVCPAGALGIYGRSRLIKKLYNFIFGNKIIRNAERCIAITHDEITQFYDYGVPEEKIIVIPNGINTEQIPENNTESFREKYGLYDAPFILFVGRLNTIKGPDLLVDAFCKLKDKLPDYHLVIAGPDEGLLHVLRGIVSKHNMEKRVHFTGYVDLYEKYQAYRAADLLVIPSRKEAMSIVALESGIVGTPVLLTDQCGFDEIEESGGGKLTTATIEGITQELANLVSNPERLSEMGNNIKHFVEKNYSWSSIIHRYIFLYDEILHNRA